MKRFNAVMLCGVFSVTWIVTGCSFSSSQATDSPSSSKSSQNVSPSSDLNTPLRSNDNSKSDGSSTTTTSTSKAANRSNSNRPSLTESTNSHGNSTSKTLTIADLRLGPIGLGDSEDEVVAKLGKPTSIEVGTNFATAIKTTNYLYPDHGIRVVFATQTKQAISIDTNLEMTKPATIKTPLGVGVLSTATAVELAYKEYDPHQELPPRDKGFGGFTVYTSDKSACIQFGYAGNKVIQMQLDYVKYYPIR